MRAALVQAGYRAILTVPLLLEDQVIGALGVSRKTPGEFAPEIVRVLTTFATQSALAIQNARLFHEIADKSRQLEVASQHKSEFLANMSHELRTPLNAILGFAQLLELDALSAGSAESVDQILRAGRHLLGLINEVLEISRIEAKRLQLSLEPVSVRETLRHAIELVGPSAAGLRVSVHVDVIDQHLHVLADRQRLQQVLLNLLSNAVKYNRPGGAVTVSCESEAGNRLRIHVSDTGPGIAPDKLERLFTPFDRLGAEGTGVEGTGLGLALSKHLVDAMQGLMHVRSQVGMGSTFSVELPLVEGPAAIEDGLPVVASGQDDDSPKARLKVLYIEDNASNLRLVERIMSLRPGVTLLSAMYGRVGLELAREHQPDLILLDRHLPDLLGDEVLRFLRDDPRTRDIPVVILSADASSRQIQRLLAAGAQAYLTKPLDVGTLLKVVDELPGQERG
jgi:signal transduction histidine kinase/ActR/RegA family two-component response regulator